MITIKNENDSPEFIERISKLANKIASIPEIERYVLDYEYRPVRYNDYSIFIKLYAGKNFDSDTVIQKVVNQFDEITDGSFELGNPSTLKFDYKF